MVTTRGDDTFVHIKKETKIEENTNKTPREAGRKKRAFTTRLFTPRRVSLQRISTPSLFSLFPSLSFPSSLFLSRFPLVPSTFPIVHILHQSTTPNPPLPAHFHFFFLVFFPLAFWSFSFLSLISCRSCSSIPETRDPQQQQQQQQQPSAISHQPALHRRLRPGVVSAGAGGTAAAGSTPVTGSLGSTGGNPSHNSFSHGPPLHSSTRSIPVYSLDLRGALELTEEVCFTEVAVVHILVRSDNWWWERLERTVEFTWLNAAEPVRMKLSIHTTG